MRLILSCYLSGYSKSTPFFKILKKNENVKMKQICNIHDAGMESA